MHSCNCVPLGKPSKVTDDTRQHRRALVSSEIHWISSTRYAKVTILTISDCLKCPTWEYNCPTWEYKCPTWDNLYSHVGLQMYPKPLAREEFRTCALWNHLKPPLQPHVRELSFPRKSKQCTHGDLLIETAYQVHLSHARNNIDERIADVCCS